MTDDDRPAGLPPRRPFHLIQAMGLIAAVSLTLWSSPALMRSVMRSYGEDSAWNPGMYFQGTSTLALAGWSLILGLALILAKWGRLDVACRSYGASAGFACSTTLLVLMVARFLEAVTFHAIYSSPRFPLLPNLLSRHVVLHDLWTSLSDSMPKAVAASVVAAWTVLAATKIGRRPASWLEIAGLLIGMAWVAWPMGGGVVAVVLLRLVTGDQYPSW